MPEGDPPRSQARRRRWPRRTAVALVVVLLLGAAATYRFDLGHRWFGEGPPSPVTEPARVPPPPGLRLPTAPRAAPVAATEVGGPVDRAAVRRAVTALLRSKRLGPHVVVRVARSSDGRVVYRHGTGRVTPASTMKLLTTVAALEALGPEHRFATSVVAGPRSRRVVLVGGGDPLLVRAPLTDGSYPARADLDTLAAATAKALRKAKRTRVGVGFDTSRFAGPSVSPEWEPSYVPDDVVSPISALWVDEGRRTPGLADRAPAPAIVAARSFARSLARRGITVTGDVARDRAPEAARTLASVESAPLAQVVQHVLEVSDNEGAEVLAHQVAVAEHRTASFTGAASAVRSVLRRIGVETRGDRIEDGSGLARRNRLRPQTLMAVIHQASSQRRPGLRSAVADLPVAGFSGSLATRFDTGDPAGRGLVRAKTGTLSGVHGLAGTLTTVDGTVLSFLAIADRVRPPDQLAARIRVDEVAAALAGCRCER